MTSQTSKRPVAGSFSDKAASYLNYIDGKFVDDGSSYIDVLNPATNDVLGRVPDSSAAIVDQAVEAARKAQPAWEALPAIQRANYLRKISAKVREHRVELADVIVKEQGKVCGLAQVEVDFTADYIDYMAEWARRLEGEILPAIVQTKRCFCSVNRLALLRAFCRGISRSFLLRENLLRLWSQAIQLSLSQVKRRHSTHLSSHNLLQRRISQRVCLTLLAGAVQLRVMR